METFPPEFDPSVIGFLGRLNRLHKGGASKPPTPKPPPAPTRVESGMDTEAAQRAGRRKGIQRTILNTAEDAAATLGSNNSLGAAPTPPPMMYGGQP